MLANAFHNGRRAGVPDCKTLAGHTVDVGFAAGGSVEGYVSDDDVVFCLISSLGRRCHSDLTAGKAFTHIVIAVSSETDAQALRNESAEALAAGSRTVQRDRILRQTVLVAAGDLLSASSRGPFCPWSAPV